MALSVDRALRKAKSFAKKGDKAQAEKLYQAIIEKFPNNNRAIQGLSHLKTSSQSVQTGSIALPQTQIKALLTLYNNGHLTDVLQQATALIKQYPHAIELHNILGAVNAGLGKHEAAIESYTKVLQIKPDHADAHNNLGVTYEELGRHEDAIKSYAKALKIKPDYAEAHNNLGVTYEELGRHEDAIKSYTKALKIKPDYAKAHSQQLHQQAHICDWDEIEKDKSIISELGISGAAVSPFSMLSFEDAPEHHLKRAKKYAEKNINA
jgi:protein O-GlcNAc transferase